MTTPSEFDAFASYRPADLDDVLALAHALRERGVRLWIADEQLPDPHTWDDAPLKAIDTLPAAVAILGKAGPPRDWGRRELSQIAARKAADPGFRFVQAVLPGVPPKIGLPAPADRVIRFVRELDDQTVIELAGALTEAAESTGTEIPLTPSVIAATRVDGPVSSFVIVRRLLEAHPEYAERRIKLPELAKVPPHAIHRHAAEWIADVRSLYDPARTESLHGRLMIDGLARIDRDLRDFLERLKALEPLRGEITPPPHESLYVKPDTVDTLTDYPADDDQLGRLVIAETLAKRIRSMRADEVRRHCDDREPEERSGGPFLLHLYGPWGMGKTSLLRFMAKQLKTRTGGEGDEAMAGRWVVIDFNAWQHQRIVPPWWWLMLAVYRQGSKALWHIDKRRWARLKAWDAWWRIKGAVPGLAFASAGLLIAWLVWKSGSVEHGEGKNWRDVASAGETIVKALSAAIALVLTLWGGMRALGRWMVVGSPRAAGAFIQTAKDPLDTLSRRFRTLINRIHYPVAIFVDDLDRCQSKYVVELLEGIQTLFKDVPVAYVVAADREWLTQSYTSEYASFSGLTGEAGRPLGYLFLEKTFQMSAAVPPLTYGSQQSYLQGLLRVVRSDDDPGAHDRAHREAEAKFAGSRGQADVDHALANGSADPVVRQAEAEEAVRRLSDPDVERRTQHTLQDFAPLLERNPRAMKRLVNAYGVNRATDILRRVDGAAEAGSAYQRVALWTILSLRWPLLADHLAENPGDADRMIARDDPPASPDWLAKLWRDPGVLAVLGGKAPKVVTELDGNAVRLSVGMAAEETAPARVPVH